MDNTPKFLYRTVDSQKVIHNHLRGDLWFRAPSYFRRKNGLRADQLEGIGTYKSGGQTYRDVTDERPIQPTFFLSTSEIPMEKFGRYIFKIHTQKLKEQVKERFVVPESTIRWKRIEYGKSVECDTPLGVGEDWNRKHYSKPLEFADEKEWRLVIRLPTTLRILNHTLKLNVGDLHGCLDLLPPQNL